MRATWASSGSVTTFSTASAMMPGPGKTGSSTKGYGSSCFGTNSVFNQTWNDKYNVYPEFHYFAARRQKYNTHSPRVVE